MAMPAYMTIKGTTMGNITEGAFTVESVGNIYQEGHENEIMIQAFSHEVIIPRDPQSGQPTGQRVHKPFKISKVCDKTSPLLMQALTTGELLKEVTINWYRTSATSSRELYYITKLEDAIIVNIKGYMHNCQDQTTAHLTQMEDVEFSYRKITWEHKIGNTESSDDWRTPAAAG
jgi:type VI secretion system secreted protein Hcp